jgi:hypothetical protein
MTHQLNKLQNHIQGEISGFAEQYWKPYQVKIGQWWLRMMGWRLEGVLPQMEKYLVVGAPHTAKRDVPIFLAGALASGRRLNWLTADIAMRFPYRRFMIDHGAIIIPYKQRHGGVDKAVELYSKLESFVLALSPEGNIYKTDYWKSGFYHIAQGANVPVVLLSGDFKEKLLRFSPPFEISGSIRDDMDRVREFFCNVTAKYPDRAAPIRLRAEDYPAQSSKNES